MNSHLQALRRRLEQALRLLLLIPLLLTVPEVKAEHLGRLFFTPEQRVMLENLKGKPQVAAQVSESITVNGLVRRTGGQSTVWINGVPQTEDRPTAGGGRAGKPVSTTSVPVVVPGSGKTIELKVGQTVEVSSGAVGEAPPRAKSAPKVGEGEQPPPCPH